MPGLPRVPSFQGGVSAAGSGAGTGAGPGAGAGAKSKLAMELYSPSRTKLLRPAGLAITSSPEVRAWGAGRRDEEAFFGHVGAGWTDGREERLRKGEAQVPGRRV